MQEISTLRTGDADLRF